MGQQRVVPPALPPMAHLWGPSWEGALNLPLAQRRFPFVQGLIERARDCSGVRGEGRVLLSCLRFCCEPPLGSALLSALCLTLRHLCGDLHVSMGCGSVWLGLCLDCLETSQ